MLPLRTYTSLALAREAALPLAARGWAYEIDRAGEEWVLLVEEPVAEAARQELTLFEEEQKAPRPLIPARDFQTFSPWPLVFVGLALAWIFFAQRRSGWPLTMAGEADAEGIVARGEWWRCFTALTLHADLSHIGANLAIGALFAGFLAPQLGGGFSWLAIVLSGALGNLINAWGYRESPHHSLGASTAVFGALGLLAAGELLFRWQNPGPARHGWLVPLGGGLALLAFLGVGEKHDGVDFMAHWWGFCAGLVLAAPMASLQQRAARWSWLAGLAAAALLAWAWWRALA